MSDSLAGHLLIAIPDMYDPNFSRTVVILFQHSEEGASGVVLNRPSDVTVARVWDEVAKEPCDCQELINIGGPVEGPLIALHTSLALAESSVIPGVFISMGRDHLNELVNQTEQQFKIFSGYSGWGAGQLESEIEQGGWLTHAANADHVFDSPEGLWKQVCSQVGNDILMPHLGKHLPGDPSLN
jgi:putative transcriptional regulator